MWLVQYPPPSYCTDCEAHQYVESFRKTGGYHTPYSILLLYYLTGDPYHTVVHTVERTSGDPFLLVNPNSVVGVGGDLRNGEIM